MRSTNVLRWLILLLLAVALPLGLIAGCAATNAKDPSPAPTPDVSAWSTFSDSGRYRVSIAPLSGEVVLGKLQEWRVRFETPTGQPFDPSRVVFLGAMPQHGHGFDNAPRATGMLGPGEVRIEGVRFHMPGDWVLRVDFAGAKGPETASFEIEVGY